MASQQAVQGPRALVCCTALDDSTESAAELRFVFSLHRSTSEQTPRFARIKWLDVIRVTHMNDKLVETKFSVGNSSTALFLVLSFSISGEFLCK